MRTKAQEIAAYTWLRVSAVAEELCCSVQHVHALTRAAGGDGRWLRTPESRRISGEASSDLPAWLRVGYLTVGGER